MESQNRRLYYQPQPPIPHSGQSNVAPQTSLQFGYLGLEMVRPQLGHSEVCPQNLRYYTHSQPSLTLQSGQVQELLLRELQKEQIRNEMIASEILRRRALVSAVRRDMILEQELAPRLGSDGPLLGSTSAVGFNTSSSFPFLGPRAEEWTLGSLDTSSLRIAEVDPVPKIRNENEKIILRANAEENVSGVKRKVLTPPPSVGGESSSDDPLRKKARSEWTCAICNVSTTSEQCLKDHLQGKKHKSKEATVKMQSTGKNYCIGFYTKKDTKPVDVNPAESLSISTAENTLSDAPSLQESQNSKKSKKLQKNNVPNKEKFRFYCDVCGVLASSEEVMKEHMQGKKHVRRMQQCNQNNGGGPSDGKEKVCDDLGH